MKSKASVRNIHKVKAPITPPIPEKIKETIGEAKENLLEFKTPWMALRSPQSRHREQMFVENFAAIGLAAGFVSFGICLGHIWGL